jgi:DNA-binding Lrp family transcriptional regulator
MKKTDLHIISQLRTNGRMPLTLIAQKTKLPVSTVHDRIKQYKRKKWLKFSALPNFEKIGFAARAYILLSVEPAEKDKLFQRLEAHPNVNSLFRINNGWNAIMECVFKDMPSMEDFVEKLEAEFHIKQKQVHYILGELKREGFLADKDCAETLFEALSP